MRFPSVLLACCLLVACERPTTAPEPAPSAQVERQVRDLVSALTLPPATANSAVRSDWHVRRRDLIEELSRAGRPLGQAVLAEYHRRSDADLDLLRGLLEVAAHNLPEFTAPELATLITEYGPHIGLRTKACELLALTDPQLAMEVLEPLITQHRPGMTLPAADIMVTAFGTAAREAGLQPVGVFSKIATNLFAEQTARHMAVKELAQLPGARSRGTLYTVLVESTGNHLLRRGAAQALVAHGKIDPETQIKLCPIFTDVMNNEADINFQRFLANMLEKYCP